MPAGKNIVKQKVKEEEQKQLKEEEKQQEEFSKIQLII
jgi:hypothetical protein